MENIDFEPGEKEWRSMVHVVRWWTGIYRMDRLQRRQIRDALGWRSEFESSLQKPNIAYRKERFVILTEDAGGSTRVMTDEKWVLREGWTDMRL